MDLRATESEAGKRLDHFLHERLQEFSRSRLQDWIKSGLVMVDGQRQRASYLLRGGESIAVQPAELPPLKAVAEDLPLAILYEDDDVIAIDKPAGVVVHAGSGNFEHTLTNALVHHFQTLSSIGGPLRPGIVHRIDRFTSGVLLVARSDASHRALAEQFSRRSVDKTYLALVRGNLAAPSGRITTPIARDPVRRTRMTTRLGSGRSAITAYRTLRRYEHFTYLEVKIGTGRTHQIRAHLASIGHPVAGDTLYGAQPGGRGRFFLHAASIGFDSPTSGRRIEVAAPLPPELEAWLAELQ